MKKITLATLLSLSLLLTGCSASAPSSIHIATEPPVEYFHKTIDVEVVDARITWSNAKTNTYRGFIEVKSNEYGLDNGFEIDNSSPYFSKIYGGNLKGQIIKAELFSKVQNDKVIYREISRLVS